MTPQLLLRLPFTADDNPELVNKEPPSLFWRCFSAMCYLVPWIDSISLGRAMYARFRNLLLAYFAPGERQGGRGESREPTLHCS